MTRARSIVLFLLLTAGAASPGLAAIVEGTAA